MEQAVKLWKRCIHAGENQLGWCLASALITEVLGALCLCATDWKGLSLCKYTVLPVNIPFPCEGVPVLPLACFKLLQRTRCTKPVKGNQLPKAPLQAAEGSLHGAIQNCSSSEFLLSWSIMPHWLWWVPGKTNPTRMKLLFLTNCLACSFQSFFSL